MSELLKKYPIKAKEYLQQLPIWPVSGSQSTIHQPATKALLPPYPALSPLGMTKTDIFIETNVASSYNQQLEQLGVKTMSLNDFLRNHVGVSLDQEISPAKKPRYLELLKILFKENSQAVSSYPLGIDGNGRFRMINSLYSSNEEIFAAAFRDVGATHFLHTDYRNLPGWKHSPLLQAISESSYLACARSIQRRGSGLEAQDQFIDDARTVFDYFCWDAREMQLWSSNTWRELWRIPFAPIKTSTVNNPDHRVPRMQELLGNKKITSIAEATIPEYAHITWSQLPILERPPSSFARRKIPMECIPPPSTVLSHLVFLSSNRYKIGGEQIPAYVIDIKACYTHLQNRIGKDSPFPVMPAAEIWFNAETEDVQLMSVEDFQASWTCSRDLCIGLEYDSLPLQRVRSLLTPFRELLMACHVRRVKAPVIPHFLHKVTDHTSLVLDGIQRLRQEGQSFDVKLVVDGQTFNAHWTVLSAVSRYFDRMFVSGMRETIERTIVFPPESEIKPKTVSILLDYMYSGMVSETKLSGNVSDDLDDIIDQLYASNLWQLDKLKDALEITLCDKLWIRPETVRDILKCAEEVRAERLARICSQYISDNIEIVERESTSEDF